MKGVAVIKRVLKDGKTYEDFRKAWFHTKGFGVDTKMFSMINVFNPKEVLVVGIMDVDSQESLECSLAIDVDERLNNPLDNIIEPGIERNFYALVAIDDFSNDGDIDYKASSIDGIETDFPAIERNIEFVVSAIMKASQSRDKKKD